MLPVGQLILRHIWKCTLQKSQIIAANVNLHPHMNALWGNLWEHTAEKSQTNATNVTLHHLMQALWGHVWEQQWIKVKQMQPMWLCIMLCKHFEDTFENAEWEKMQPMRPCLFWARRFEETFENALWRKVKQMQPMWLCIPTPKFFEDTYEPF